MLLILLIFYSRATIFIRNSVEPLETDTKKSIIIKPRFPLEHINNVPSFLSINQPK